MSYKRCSCPIWVYGTLEGKYIRRSIGTRVWDRALVKIGKWEHSGAVEYSVKECLERFLEDVKARGLGSAQTGKYQLLKREMEKEFGDRKIGSIGLDELAKYRESWQMRPVSARKKLERLRTFFKFCMDRSWISRNPAKSLKAPVGDMAPTIPFSKEEMEKILESTEKYPERPRGRRGQVLAFVLLLRYSGLRIGDATALKRNALQDGKLMLYTAKTGTAVWIPLPDHVVNTLEKLPIYFNQSEHFFWSGKRTLKSAVSGWQKALGRLFRLAEVKGHAHMFRHTLAVDFLNKGVSLENVAAILGNTVRVCEKHYAPWVKSRQESLEAEVEKAWSVK